MAPCFTINMFIWLDDPLEPPLALLGDFTFTTGEAAGVARRHRSRGTPIDRSALAATLERDPYPTIGQPPP